MEVAILLDINIKETTNNAKHLLKNYGHYERLAKRSDSQLSIRAKEVVKAIDDTINNIDDELYQFILINRFITKNDVKSVAKHVGLGKSQFSNKQREALLVFAECYPLDNLIVGD